jgi:hypothetical protein
MWMQAAAARAVSQRLSNRLLQARCNAHLPAYRWVCARPRRSSQWRVSSDFAGVWLPDGEDDTHSEIHVIQADGSGDARLPAR